MAANKISHQYTTISISTAGDTVEMRGNWVRMRNFGANAVSFAINADGAPTGVPTAGNQSSLNKYPANGYADEVFVPPWTVLAMKADTGACLVGFEEIWTPPFKMV